MLHHELPPPGTTPGRPRMRAADPNHIARVEGNFSTDGDDIAVCLFQHERRSEGALSGLPGIGLAFAASASAAAAAAQALEVPAFEQRARVMFDAEDEDLQFLEVKYPLAPRPPSGKKKASAERVRWRNAEGHLVHLSPASSRGDELASVLAGFTF